MMTVDVKFQRITIVHTKVGLAWRRAQVSRPLLSIILVLFHRFQVLSILRTCAFIVDTFMFVGIK